MAMVIRRLKTTETTPPSFYIARVGSKSGCPSKQLTYNPTNVFGVWSDDPDYDFQAVKLAYDLKCFYPYLIGSCQPQLRVTDCRRVIEQMPTVSTQSLQTLTTVQATIEKLAAQLEEAQKLQTQLQRSIFTNAKKVRHYA